MKVGRRWCQDNVNSVSLSREVEGTESAVGLIDRFRSVPDDSVSGTGL